MARICPITAKTTSTGNNVSHSKRRTKRTWKANMITKKLMDETSGAVRKTKISAKGLRILTKDLIQQADFMFDEIQAEKSA
ncbi:50S ribosomal protein L28 [Candidatus Gracilibacteria bacterium]|nr:50S ribosomal protein L28 [Candidatus Gracilibacteria bacterium]